MDFFTERQKRSSQPIFHEKRILTDLRCTFELFRAVFIKTVFLNKRQE